MNACGQNGLICALICLRWWRDKLRDGDLADWEEAVADVHWVLKEMVGQEAQGAAQEEEDVS